MGQYTEKQMAAKLATLAVAIREKYSISGYVKPLDTSYAYQIDDMGGRQVLKFKLYDRNGAEETTGVIAGAVRKAYEGARIKSGSGYDHCVKLNMGNGKDSTPTIEIDVSEIIKDGLEGKGLLIDGLMKQRLPKLHPRRDFLKAAAAGGIAYLSLSRKTDVAERKEEVAERIKNNEPSVASDRAQKIHDLNKQGKAGTIGQYAETVEAMIDPDIENYALNGIVGVAGVVALLHAIAPIARNTAIGVVANKIERSI